MQLAIKFQVFFYRQTEDEECESVDYLRFVLSILMVMYTPAIAN